MRCNKCKKFITSFNYNKINIEVSIEVSIEYVCLRMHGMLITTKNLLDN
jgi:hypothetical protein